MDKMDEINMESRSASQELTIGALTTHKHGRAPTPPFCCLWVDQESSKNPIE